MNILYAIRETVENVARATVTEEICFSGQMNIAVGHAGMKGKLILVCSDCVEFASDDPESLAGALVFDCTEAPKGTCEICQTEFPQ